MRVSESEVHVEIQEAPNHIMASLRKCDLSRMHPVPVQLEASPMYHAMSLGGYTSPSTRRAPPTSSCRSFTVSGRLPRSRGSK